MNVIFFGTDDFASHCLDFLINSHINVLAVVTRPDKPRGRSLQMLPSPVKELVISRYPHLPLFEPIKASAESFVEILRNFQADLFIVGFYGEILKANVLSLPRKGCINIHPSLLPKYRGPSPIRSCLMNGDKETGVTIIEMTLQMDAGDILGTLTTPIEEETIFGGLKEKLMQLACPLLLEVIYKIDQDAVQKLPQNEKEVTFTRKIQSEDRKIDWSKSAEAIHNQIRALSPTPGAFCLVKMGNEEKRLLVKRSKIHRELSDAHIKACPGQTLKFDKKQWVISCGVGAIELVQVQLEGKQLLQIEAFLRGVSEAPLLVGNLT